VVPADEVIDAVWFWALNVRLVVVVLVVRDDQLPSES
jgi:hypothetical protein